MLTPSETNVNQLRKSLMLHLIFFSSVIRKLIPPLQRLNSIFQNIRYLEKIGTILEEGFFFISGKILIAKMLQKHVIPRDFEILTFGLKLYKSNCLVIGAYKPPSLNGITFISEIRKILTYYILASENI